MLAIENREFIEERAIDGIVLISDKKLPRNWRNLRGRPQPRCAAHHGIIPSRRGSSCETQKLQSSWYLPDDGASLELADDRTGDVAVVPATSEASVI